MEGKIKSVQRSRSRSPALALSLILFLPGLSIAEQAGGREERPAQLELRKTPLKTREYQGKTVEGEERVVTRGDSLWRLLIEEKGLSEKRFGRYLVIISSLNPHLKKPDVLQVGQTLFIPIRPDEILGIEVPTAAKGETKLYRVRKGDYLYKILRDQFGIQEKKEMRSSFDQVKGLNPNKKNWNILFVGEAILFPGAAKEAVAAAPPLPKAAEGVGLDYGRNLPAEQNLQLLEQVMGALGNEIERGGEEVLPLQEGNVHIDRDSYPVIRNPKAKQRVILDTTGKIPSSLKSKLDAPGSVAPVVSIKKGDSLHDAVNNLLPRLGYQPLPSNRPVEFHDGGLGMQVKGEWMVAAPDEGGGKQDVIIINLTDLSGKTPDYLRDYLSLRGMNLKEILLPSSPFSAPAISAGEKGQAAAYPVERWPRDKGEMIDSLLRSYGVSFARAQEITVPLREGIRLETKIDRLFESGGRKVALVFHPLGDEAKRALQEREGIRAVELDLRSLSSRELISRLLELLGDKSVYREHRFPAVEGAARDKMVLTVSGFLLASRSLLLTDREVPKELRVFFAEKGLRLVEFE